MQELTQKEQTELAENLIDLIEGDAVVTFQLHHQISLLYRQHNQDREYLLHTHS